MESQEKYVKFSISLPPDLFKILENYSKENEIERSRVIQLALRRYFDEVTASSEEVYGFLIITYDHTLKEVEDKITEIQHKHIDKIISSQHIHVSKNICTESIAVRGNKGELVKILSELSSVKGIELVRFITSWVYTKKD
jgi:CopG family nickel-responsive transcriptional regulator